MLPKRINTLISIGKQMKFASNFFEKTPIGKSPAIANFYQHTLQPLEFQNLPSTSHTRAVLANQETLAVQRSVKTDEEINKISPSHNAGVEHRSSGNPSSKDFTLPEIKIPVADKVAAKVSSGVRKKTLDFDASLRESTTSCPFKNLP